MAKSRANETLILKIAMLYYEGGMTQDEISKKYGMSRPTVVRILKQAREEGFVEIRITKTLPETSKLETEIEKLFAATGLQEVVVVDSETGDAKLSVARAAAEHLTAVVKPNDVVGLAWSSTLLDLPDFVDVPRRSPIRVVQLGGGVRVAEADHAHEIVFRLGRKLGAPVEAVNAPVLVKNKSVLDGLLDDPGIESARRWAEKCTIALMGVGTADANSTLVKAGYLSVEDVETAASNGAVGDILSHYFDVDGKEVNTPWRDRLISRSFEEIAKIDNVILVAAGKKKAVSLLGALRLQAINTVVLDTGLAKALLALVSKRKAKH